MTTNCVYDTTKLPFYFVLELSLYPYYYIIEQAYYRAENRTYPKERKRW